MGGADNDQGGRDLERFPSVHGDAVEVEVLDARAARVCGIRGVSLCGRPPEGHYSDTGDRLRRGQAASTDSPEDAHAGDVQKISRADSGAEPLTDLCSRQV